MKRLLPLLLCAVLALFCATTAQAAGVSITLTASEYALHYAFDAGAQDPFVILEYATPAEKGWMMLYSEDGHFEGDVSLAYSGAGGKTSVALTSARTTGSIGKASTTLPKAADYQKPTGKSNAKVTDFMLTETPEGFHYAFNAAGTDYMLLYWRSKEQTVTQPVYPDENGHYEGDVVSELTFARTQFTVQVKSGSGSMKKEATVRKGYQAPEAPQRQEGRLSGVTVCIDAGHQENGRFVNEPIGPGLSGSTSGKGGMAQGTKTNRRESIVCLEIGMLLRDELLRQGANVVMTREDQTTFHTNIERCEIAEAGGAQIMQQLQQPQQARHTGLRPAEQRLCQSGCGCGHLPRNGAEAAGCDENACRDDAGELHGHGAAERQLCRQQLGEDDVLPCGDGVFIESGGGISAGDAGVSAMAGGRHGGRGV